MKLTYAGETDNAVIHQGMFDGRIRIQTESANDGRDTIEVYANEQHVGTLVSPDVVERQESEGTTFDDSIAELLETANIGR